MRKHIVSTGFTSLCLAASLAISCSKDSPSPVTTTATAPASAAAAATTTPAKPMATITVSQGPFEGEIEIKVERPGAISAKAVVYEVKADKVRYEEGGSTAPSYAIANLGQKKAYAIADSHKDYIEVPTDTSSMPPAETVQVKKTGKTEKVAGVECELWQMTTSKEQFEVCAAREIAYFDLVSPTPNTAMEPAWANELTKAKAFPLRLVERDKSGKEQLRAEATKISRKPVDQARFGVPAGYRKVAVSKDTPVFGIP